MSDDLVQPPVEGVPTGPQDMDELKAHFHDMMELFDELSFKEKWQRVFAGLKQPMDTGEHKWARLQMIRLSAPISAVVVPALLLLIMALVPAGSGPARNVTVQIVDPEKIEELDKIEEIKQDIPEPETEITYDAEVTVDQPVVNAPPTDFSPQPTPVDAVAIVKSPVIMRGIYGSRTPGMRGSLMGRHGAPAGTEEAVLRALRWLKKYQEYDGKWMAGAGGGVNYSSGVPAAMTGLGLLTFLAHGETPTSEEFGETVEKAIRWLATNQKGNGHFEGADAHEYGHPIAAYALCEAYGMTKIPMLKNVAEKAIDVIIEGQQAGGGWNYNCSKPNPKRNDTSYSAWCGQALKAAKMAGLQNKDLKKSIEDGVRGYKENAAQYGGFGYTDKGSTRLTGAGVLCMQLLGHQKDSEVQSGMGWMREHSTCKWDKGGNQGARPIYYWYYETQAFFHHGGEDWKKWNRLFATELCRNQKVVPKAIAGPKGSMVDIGYWESLTADENYGFTYNTTLCALMLQVYYRFLPTYQTIKEDDAPVLEDKTGDIKIDIKA